MTFRYAEVALPVPLRSAFTYAVPASLDGQPLVGRRVMVPFGRRTMIGVALSETDHVAESVHLPSPLKEIAELIDPLPALPPKLVVEVQFDHFASGRFRHGTKFLRWRPEKAPSDCTMKQVVRENKSALNLL